MKMDLRDDKILALAGGLVWGGLLMWIGSRLGLPVFTLVPTVMVSLLAPGAVLAAMVLARYFGVIKEEVISDTIVHLVLALCIWPGAAVLLAGHGPGVVAALSGGLVLSRMMFWLGQGRFRRLQALGQGASLMPSVLVALWALWELVL